MLLTYVIFYAIYAKINKSKPRYQSHYNQYIFDLPFLGENPIP
jgi:hypothetical protein